jgi:hypothetical protein
MTVRSFMRADPVPIGPRSPAVPNSSRPTPKASCHKAHMGAGLDNLNLSATLAIQRSLAMCLGEAH